MKRTTFVDIPDRPHYWLSDARAQVCLVGNGPLGKPDFEGLVRFDLEIKDGRIAGIAPLGTAPAGAVDLKGGLVWPGFVDIHTHLDKGHIWPRSPNPDGSFLGAATSTAPSASPAASTARIASRASRSRQSGARIVRSANARAISGSPIAAAALAPPSRTLAAEPTSPAGAIERTSASVDAPESSNQLAADA